MSDAGWIHPGPISPLDCDQDGCGWRVHGVPDKHHASALARHTAEAHQTAGDASVGKTEGAYPIRPRPDDDPRFTFGLAHDVAEVLQKHGYPSPNAGGDWVDLKLALFRFLYGSTDTEATS